MEEQVSQPAPIPQKSTRGKRKGLTIVFFLILIIAGGFFVFKQLNLFKSSSEIETPEFTPTPTEFQFPTDTPTPMETSTPTPKITTAPTAKPTSSPIDKTTGLDRSELSVEVQNGSGEKLVGSKGSDVLKSFGYHVVSIGNADNFNYESVTIKVKSEKSKYLSLLKSDLGTAYTVGATSSDLSASSSADALVIIGK